ncbi:hypothetical protein QBC34DRAFT_496707, partial [Podospora aff. communis PSN243]
MASTGLIVGLSVGLLGSLALGTTVIFFAWQRRWLVRTLDRDVAYSYGGFFGGSHRQQPQQYAQYPEQSPYLFGTVAPRDVEYGPNPAIFNLTMVPREIRPVIKPPAPASPDHPLERSASSVSNTVPGPAAREQREVQDTDSADALNATPAASLNEYQCRHCQLRFDKAYLLNKHITRKHERRYKCNSCDSAFALRADLLRHERARHPNPNEKDGAETSQLFLCKNTGCKTPNKVFNRKDNLMRHSARCAM